MVTIAGTVSGYAKPVIRFTFPQLSTDPGNDPIWVVIRNPLLLPTEELASVYDGNSGIDPETRRIIDAEAAKVPVNKIIAKLVVAGRAYDATVMPDIDPLTGEFTSNPEPVLLPAPPWTPETAGRLAGVIRHKIQEAAGEALNPSRAQPEEPTPKTSSS